MLLIQSSHSHFIDPVTAVLVAAAIGFVIAVWAIKRALAQRRTRQLADAAVRIGFVFNGEAWTDRSRAPVLGTHLFELGRDGGCRNVMTGSHGNVGISLFDYSFTTGSGRSQSTYTQTVAAFSKEGISIPNFALCQSGVLDKIGNVFTHKNIHIDSNPEFSRRYSLHGALEDKVRDLFAPGLVSYFDALDPHSKWHVEGMGSTLIVYRLAKKISPDLLRSFLDETSSIANSFFSLAKVTVLNTVLTP